MSQSKINLIKYIVLALAVMVLGLIILASSSGADEITDGDRFTGERFEYVIKKFGLQVGTATLEYKGLLDLEGRKAVLIVFRADGFNFLDEEKIYADPQTLLPIRIERDLNIFGSKENLTEFYDAVNHKVRIVKYKKGKQVDEMVFEKERPIDNLYCFLFRFRRSGIFSKGEALEMFLPTKDVKFEIVEKKEISFYPKAEEAWFMQSDPKKYKVWFGVDKKALPLRIDGAVGLASTSMVLKTYSIPEN